MSVTQTQAILEGDRLTLTRILSLIENDTPEGHQILEELFPHTGNAHLVGITGAPGTGKSTLVNRLVYQYRNPEKEKPTPSIAVIAVDPSSPFSGGALLGDRVRMQDLAGDPGVFIRSMASRGSLGGLARTTAGLTQVFDAAGFEIIIIETVGAGQGEVDIARLAHTTIVIEAPGFGDEIQTIKAGILEIADILVVNKGDKPGADNALRALRNMLSLSQPEAYSMEHHGEMIDVTAVGDGKNTSDQSWVPPILKTTATTGEGVSFLIDEITSHQDYLQKTGNWILRDQARLTNEVENLLQAALLSRWKYSIESKVYEKVMKKVINRKMSPRRAADELIQKAGL